MGDFNVSRYPRFPRKSKNWLNTSLVIISEMPQENTCVGVRPATLLKRGLHKCFLVKFAKFLKTIIFKNISERLLLCIDYFGIYWFLQFTKIHVFHFYKLLFLFYAIKTIELMTRKVVSFEKIFHWTKFQKRG